MKRMSIAGACILGALAIGLVGATSAMASLPEAGRCVKVARGTGAYSASTCVAHATKGGGQYEWVPVTGTEKQTFTGSSNETKLTTVGHPTIKCIDTNLSGEYTGPKTATVTLELQGCQSPTEQPCQSTQPPQNRTEIKTLPLEGELGFIKNEAGKVQVGLDLKPQPPLTELASYECTGSPEVAHVTGSLIGKVFGFDKMTTTLKIDYLATKTGEQRIQKFENGPVDTLTTTFTNGLETVGSGASSLNLLEETGHNTNPLEIKALDK